MWICVVVLATIVIYMFLLVKVLFDISSEHSLAGHTILTVTATTVSPSYLSFGSSPNSKDFNTSNQMNSMQ